MPSRIIRDEILTSERVDLLDFAAEVFYRRLLNKVDDYGLYDARPSVLRATLYPLRIDRVREADCSRWIAACEKAGLIALYHHDGKPYLQVLRVRWQIRAAPKYPMPPEDVNTCKQVEACAHLVVDVDAVVVAEKAHGRQADRFSEFWELYPKKVARKPAAEKWKAKKLDAKASEILADVRARMKSDRRWLEGYIPNATTYLTQERWQDEIQGAVKPPSAVPSGKPAGPSESPLENQLNWIAEMVRRGVMTDEDAVREREKATAKHRGVTA
jgi:hypothetical protein